MSAEPQTLTQSSAAKFLWCNRAYYWRYVKELVPVKLEQRLFIGQLFHKALEAYDKELATSAEEYATKKTEAARLVLIKAVDRQEMDETKIALFLVQQYDLWRHQQNSLCVLASEVAFDIPLWRTRRAKSPKIRGKMDAIAEDPDEGSVWVLERKTTYSIDDNYLAKLPLDKQITTYLIGARRKLDRPIRGVVYDVICRPRTYRRKGESVEEWLERASIVYAQSPDEYFARQRCIRTQQDVADTIEYYKEVRRLIRRCFRRNVWLQNTNVCFVRNRECPYAELCIEGATARALLHYRLEKPHAELEN